MELSQGSYDFAKLLGLNHIFYQDHLSISSIGFTIILIMMFRNGIFFSSAIQLLGIIIKIKYIWYY